MPTKHFYSHNLGKDIIFKCPSQLGKSDTYRGMPFKLSQPQRMGAKQDSMTFLEWSAKLCSWEPAEPPGASQQSNAGISRGCSPIAWLPGSQGSGNTERKQDSQEGRDRRMAAPTKPHLWYCRKVIIMPPWFTPHWGFVDILLLLVVTHLCVIQQIWTEIYCVPSILLDHGVGNGVW